MSEVLYSFVRLIFPFTFDHERFLEFTDLIRTRQCSTLGNVWEHRSFPDGELLPHVARFLNPPEGTTPTARLWRLTNLVLQSPKGLGAGPKNTNTSWNLVHGDSHTQFMIEDVQLALFCTGVGFLSFRTNPRVTSLENWLNYLHYARFIDQRGVFLTVSRSIGFDKEKDEAVVEAYSPGFCLRESGRETGELVFTDLIQGLLGPTEHGNWWEDVFISGQALPYTVLFAEGIPDAQLPGVVHKVHNFFHSKQGENPAEEDLQLNQSFLLPYADHQWFTFSLDGGAFVAFDPPPTDFFKATLPHHLDTEYLLLYLLVLHQRFALISFSERVSRHWFPTSITDSAELTEKREAEFRKIRDGVLAFTARGYFAQVMQRWHHHRAYLRWQETLQIERLFKEVVSEVQEMHNYLLIAKTERIKALAEANREQSGRTERRLNFLAAFLLLPGLILNFLNAIGNSDWNRAWHGVLLGLAIGTVLMFCLEGRWLSRTCAFLTKPFRKGFSPDLSVTRPRRRRQNR